MFNKIQMKNIFVIFKMSFIIINVLNIFLYIGNSKKKNQLIT